MSRRISAKDIELQARLIALANGHKDPDAEIICMGGKREPVWRFYREEAADALVRC